MGRAFSQRLFSGFRGPQSAHGNGALAHEPLFSVPIRASGRCGTRASKGTTERPQDGTDGGHVQCAKAPSVCSPTSQSSVQPRSIQLMLGHDIVVRAWGRAVAQKQNRACTWSWPHFWKIVSSAFATDSLVSPLAPGSFCRVSNLRSGRKVPTQYRNAGQIKTSIHMRSIYTQGRGVLRRITASFGRAGFKA